MIRGRVGRGARALWRESEGAPHRFDDQGGDWGVQIPTSRDCRESERDGDFPQKSSTSLLGVGLDRVWARAAAQNDNRAESAEALRPFCREPEMDGDFPQIALPQPPLRVRRLPVASPNRLRGAPIGQSKAKTSGKGRNRHRGGVEWSRRRDREGHVDPVRQGGCASAPRGQVSRAGRGDP